MSSFISLSYKQRLECSDRLDDIILNLPEGRPRILVSEFATRRILPEGSPYPGAWRHDRTPFFVEIMDCLSASSPIREIAFVKPAQIGGTAGIVENFIAYIIACNPGPTLYLSANDRLIKQWNDTRLIPLLKSTGLEGYLHASTVIGKRNRSGVTTHLKEFPGGVLGTGTGMSEASLRSNPYCNIIFDEVSSYPISANGKGDPIGLGRARSTNFANRKKLIYLSTPGSLGSCKITFLFEQGDQCYWFVRCPHCGEEIVFEFSKEYAPYHEKMDLLEKDFGLVWEMNGKQLVEDSIRYKCTYCGYLIKESEKWEISQSGRWKPTDVSFSKTYRSFQISGLASLLSPWKDIVLGWIACADNEEEKKSFVTTKLGVAYKVTSVKPKFASLLSLRGSYNEHEVPPGVLFLTASVDVQQGSRTDEKRPPRLEMEICGHGLNERTWSIEYKKFIGPIEDPTRGAWDQLYTYITSNAFEYNRFDGQKFHPTVGFIDARSGIVTSVVCAFCNRVDFWFPSMSNNKDIRQSDDAEQFDGPKVRDNIVPYKESKSGDNMIILMSPNWFKRKIYSKLKVERELGQQKYGFCEFPRNYDEVYFRGLVSEDMLIDGSFIKRKAIANEPLDLRVMNECAARFYLDLLIRKRREYLIKTKQWSQEMARTVVNSKFVLQELESMLKVKATRV